MTKTYFPFDAGAGSAIVEAQWQQFMRKMITTGVIQGELNKLEVFGDSSGMNVKVKSGQAWMEGHFFQSDAQETLSIATSDPTNPRWDLAIVRINWTANTIDLAVLTGTPAGSPSEPALTQTSTTWEIALARVVVGAGVSTITAGNVVDKRVYAKQGWDEFVLPITVGDGTSVVTTGVKGYIPNFPVDADVIGWTIVGDASGSIVVDLWAEDYASGVPTVADTIVVGATKPTLSSAQLNKNDAISGWVRVLKGDTLGINVDSATTIKQATVGLRFKRVY